MYRNRQVESAKKRQCRTIYLYVPFIGIIIDIGIRYSQPIVSS
jgi:hypothetical protein